MSLTLLRWPYPCKWAFSLIDDNDFSTLQSARTVYDWCLARRIHPTKTVWLHEPRRECGAPRGRVPIAGATLDDAAYLAYMQHLGGQGVELCLHDVSSANNLREEIVQGFARFEELFGSLPRVHVFHAYNCDHIYWGPQQYRSAWARAIVRRVAGPYEYYGQQAGSPHYWSDVCRRMISYVRLYRTRRFNVLRCNPSMPYHLPDKPDVRLWFSASGSRRRLHRLDERALDRLAREDGAFLLYSYSAHLVQKNDPARLAPDVETALTRISQRDDCWRPTVSRLLDRCLATKNLVVSERRHAYVICNPTRIPVDDLQFKSARSILYLSAAEVLRPDTQERYRIERLEAGQCITLYFSADAADAGDPGGISPFEAMRMMLEELWHLAWKRGNRLRFRQQRRKRARGR